MIRADAEQLFGQSFIRLQTACRQCYEREARFIGIEIGDALDTDPISFGAVLDEMAAGCHAFTGKTTAVTLTAIFNLEPRLNSKSKWKFRRNRIA